MHLEDIAKHLERRAHQQWLVYVLGTPAPEATIEEAEQSLGVVFPSQVKDFYRFYNGLRVEEPHLEILAVEEIRNQKAPLVHFATVNREHQLCFDTSRINEAGQWDIVTADGYRITLTMASFWSNKIWAWIDKRRHIWQSEA